MALVTGARDLSVARGRNLETGPEVESAGHPRATKGMVECGRGQDSGPLRGNIIPQNKKV